MTKTLARAAMFALLLALPGCDVFLTQFSVPVQAAAGTTITVVIEGDITGTAGEAGCVLQLPNGWTVLGQNYTPTWGVGLDSPTLLGTYVAEPGHYLVGYSGTGRGGIGGAQYLSHIRIDVFVQIPATALGPYVLKTSLAGAASLQGAFTIEEPAGIAQFAQITAAPYARSITVSPAPAFPFFAASTGLPPASGLPQWMGAACGDIDGDGRDDLAATSLGASPRCWRSLPGDTWSEQVPFVAPTSAWGRITFAQLDGDAFLDFVDGSGNVFFGNGGTSWTQGAPLPLLRASGNYLIAAGDVDSDGLRDIAIAADNVLQVLLNNGNRTFRDASTGLPATSVFEESGDLLLVDLNGDGHLDLYWAHPNPQNLWLGNGQGLWTPAGFFSWNATAAAAADLDGDGVPELIASTTFGGIFAMKHAGGTSWSPLTWPGFSSSGVYSALAPIDFDRDGRPDLVGGVESGQSGLELWRNTGAGFAAVPLSGLPPFFSGKVQDIAVGDFDGNTFPDLAVATSSTIVPTTSILQAFLNGSTGVAPFGSGCTGGTSAAPVLASVGAPQRGNTAFAMRVLQTPGEFALFWFGASRTSAPPFALPLDLGTYGAPGCTLWAAPEFMFSGLIGPGGDTTIPLPVPNDPFFALVTVYAQSSVFASTANPFGMVFSAAAAIRIE